MASERQLPMTALSKLTRAYFFTKTNVYHEEKYIAFAHGEIDKPSSESEGGQSCFLALGRLTAGLCSAIAYRRLIQDRHRVS
jgi:hypothetical protein